MAIFNENGECLFVQRGLTDPWEPGKWCFPGGKVEKGEDEEEGVKREAYEEAGVIIHSCRMIKKSLTPGGWTHFMFVSDDFSGEVEFNDGEMIDHHWATEDEAHLLPLIKPLKPVVLDIYTLYKKRFLNE